MDPSEIKDSETLKAWLKTQSQAVAVTIAHRSAMRVAPLFWRVSPPTSCQHDLIATSLCRQLLISGVAAKCPTPKIKRIATTATTAVPDPAVFARYAAAAAADAATAATDAAAAARYATDAAFYFANAAPDAVAYRMRASLVADAGLVMGAKYGQAALASPLWRDARNPFEADWGRVRAAWSADETTDWQFWIDWYEAALAGRPLLGDWDRHWALLTEVALLPDDDWKAGQQRVNARVAAIYERHRLKQLAEELLKENQVLRQRYYSEFQPPRDHNRPPEMLDDAAAREVVSASDAAHEAVREIDSELASEKPDPEKLEQSASKLSNALATVLKYLGQKADRAFDGLIDWGVPFGTAWLVANSGNASALISGVQAFAKSIAF